MTRIPSSRPSFGSPSALRRCLRLQLGNTNQTWCSQEVIERADKVVVPVMPSVFDMQATSQFLLQLVKITEKLPTQVAVVGNRVDGRTISAANLRKFVDAMDVQVLSYLRDTQYYLHMAAHGLSLFDITPSKVQKDLEQWSPICQWLDQD